MIGGFANHGQVTVTAGQHLLMMGASPEDAHPEQFSTGTFTGPSGTSFNVAFTELHTGAHLDGVMADHFAVPGGNTVMLGDGSSIAGDAVVGQNAVLNADLGPSGTATLTGVGVQGTVRVSSGTVDVVAPDPESWADGVLTGGRYVAAHGATLNLPATHILAATLRLMDLDSSFGGLDDLHSITPTGELGLLHGADLTLGGALENLGRVGLSAQSDLRLGGAFDQGAGGELATRLSAVGHGQVIASGRLALDGDLVVRRGAHYRPEVGTRLSVLRGITRHGTEFARVLGRDPFAGRRLVADYSRPDRMRLRVVAHGS